MALSSMTGFARSHGASGPYTFEWELKSVNAKGFDLRMRLPAGWDDLEAFAKKRAGEVLSRGTVYANLNVKRTGAASTIRINEEVLASIVRVAGEHAGDPHDRGQHLFIDADGRGGAGALDVEIGVHRAARQHLAGALLGERLEVVPSSRQPHPQVEALGVDRFQFPFERIRSAGAVASGKAGHARQRHRVNFSKTLRGARFATDRYGATLAPIAQKWI